MQPDEIRKKKVKTPEQALAALMRLCARAEKSQEDARRLMRGWGLAERDAEGVLAKLVRDCFIDDARYAGAFVREKLRLSGWGEYKIRHSPKPTARRWANACAGNWNGRHERRNIRHNTN